MHNRTTIGIIVIMLLFISFFTNGIFVIRFVNLAGAPDITTWSDTNTTINVTVYRPLPIINWYDFQNSTGSSKLNSRIDVDQQYKFVVNITNDRGWADIEYINITTWFDAGNEGYIYNNSGNLGGNLNMFIQYVNTTGVAQYIMRWPDDEVIQGSMLETEIDPNTHNISFLFTPRYQVRYAPGDGSWDTNAGHNDQWSWNFNITVEDVSNNKNSTENEYGTFMYTRITKCTENPSGAGIPGENDIALNPHTNVTTRCNANYSLTTNLPNLTDGKGNYLQNTSLSADGGDLSRTNFDGVNPLYIYGTSSSYRNHLPNTYEDTVKVRYWVNISMGAAPGYYSSQVTYTINGEIQ